MYMRVEFPPNQVSKLPKETKAQVDARRADSKLGINCQICGGWHHRNAVHLDYVGHAALTNRLLDADPAWNWEPVAWTSAGLPTFDATGGLWIRLTVCGVTRLGYGHAAAKSQMDPGAREKEVIGDALRNAAMRFGAALDLWHKGDLHADEATDGPSAAVTACTVALELCQSADQLAEWHANNAATLKELSEADRAEIRRLFAARKAALRDADPFAEAA